MKFSRVRYGIFGMAAALAAAPVMSASAQETGVSVGPATDVVPTLAWAAVGVACFAVILGALYLLKRRVGGFPKSPSWVAPISIRPSRDFPGDTDPHEATSPHDDRQPLVHAHPPKRH